MFYSRIDYKNFSFLGLPDTYSKYEDCIDINSHFGRLNFGEVEFDKESFNYKISNSLKYA